MSMLRTVASKIKSVTPKITSESNLCVICGKVLKKDQECDCAGPKGKTNGSDSN